METHIPKEKKNLEALVISDTHLGTYGCKAEALLEYLTSVSTPILILNGDIIDIWQFSKSYFPKSHLQVIRQIIKMMENGTRVHYLAGNHDEHLRRLIGMRLGNLVIENKMILELDGKKSWIFHGDVFDAFMHHSKWLAKLGAIGYGMLTVINSFINACLSFFKMKRVSLSRNIKNSVKKGGSELSSKFERTVADMAIIKGYEYAICGHIHWPEKKVMENELGQVCYLNSGDWVENMTALEYYNGDWHLVHFKSKQAAVSTNTDELVNDDYLLPNHKVLFQTMYNDIVNS